MLRPAIRRRKSHIASIGRSPRRYWAKTRTLTMSGSCFSCRALRIDSATSGVFMTTRTCTTKPDTNAVTTVHAARVPRHTLADTERKVDQGQGRRRRRQERHGAPSNNCRSALG